MQCGGSFLKYETKLKVFCSSQDQYNHNFWLHLEKIIFLFWWGFWTPLMALSLKLLNTAQYVLVESQLCSEAILW